MGGGGGLFLGLVFSLRDECIQQLIPFQSAGRGTERKEEDFFFFFSVSQREREGIFPEKPRHLLSAVRRQGELWMERCRSRPRPSLGAPLTNWEERPRA